LELGLPVAEGLVVGGVDGFLGVAQPDEGEVVGRAGRLGELGGKGGELREEALSYTAGAC